MDHVILKTKRIEMKFPLDFITAEDIIEAIADEQTLKYMDSVPSLVYTDADAKNFIGFLEYTRYLDTALELGLFELETERFIGMCTLENIHKKTSSCELGYWLDSRYVGKGYMEECAKTIIDYAQNTLHIKTIHAFVITEHIKSIRLLERLGFSNKELLRNNTENKGAYVDRYRFELS